MNVQITSTMSNAEQTLGTVDGILSAASSKLFQDDIARMFYAHMARGFDVEYRTKAFANPSRYGHMYDWNLLGRPDGKLWKHHLQGRPGARRATFSYLPSVRNVPEKTPQNTYIRPEDFPNLKTNGRHRFPAKAMVFESGQQTEISPKGRAMFIPLFWKSRSGKRETNFSGEVSERDRARGYVWTSKTVIQTHTETAGAFTGSFLEYYANNSDRVFAEKVEPRINNRIRKVYTARVPNMGGNVMVSKGSKNRSRRFSVSAVADASKIADADLRREMKRAVKEALTEVDDIDAFE